VVLPERPGPAPAPGFLQASQVMLPLITTAAWATRQQAAHLQALLVAPLGLLFVCSSGRSNAPSPAKCLRMHGVPLLKVKLENDNDADDDDPGRPEWGTSACPAAAPELVLRRDGSIDARIPAVLAALQDQLTTQGHAQAREAPPGPPSNCCSSSCNSAVSSCWGDLPLLCMKMRPGCNSSK